MLMAGFRWAKLVIDGFILAPAGIDDLVKHAGFYQVITLVRLVWPASQTGHYW